MAAVIGTIPKPVRSVQGVLKVGDTRVSLDTVVYEFNRGADAAKIQKMFVSLSLAQVHSAIAYYLHNKEEVDRYLVKREAARAKMKQELQAAFQPKVTRDELVARKSGSISAPLK